MRGEGEDMRGGGGYEGEKEGGVVIRRLGRRV